MNQNKHPLYPQITVKRIALLNRYYRISRFYSFLINTAYKGGIVAAVFIGIILGLEFFLLDFNSILNSVVNDHSPKTIMLFFMLTETVFGLVPPEAFIIWASKTASPWSFLLGLSVVSHIAGIINYLIGNSLHLLPSLRNYIKNKAAKHIVNLKKWGGLFVVIGAITPLPYSIVSMAAGLIKYSFKKYFLWSFFRYVRFVIYAIIIFNFL